MGARDDVDVALLELEVDATLEGRGLPTDRWRPPSAAEIASGVNLSAIERRLDRTAVRLARLMLLARGLLLDTAATEMTYWGTAPAARLRLADMAVSTVPEQATAILGLLRSDVEVLLTVACQAAEEDVYREVGPDGLLGPVAFSDGDPSPDQTDGDQPSEQSTSPAAAVLVLGLLRTAIRLRRRQAELIAARAAALVVGVWTSTLSQLSAAAARLPGATDAAELAHTAVGQVRREGSVAGLNDLARQTVNAAQGIGRIAAGANLRPTITAISSELLDSRTCGPCSDIDGTVFATLDEAQAAYPDGQYVDCLGGERCRGQLIYITVDDMSSVPAR